MIKRELEGYKLADRIAIPSSHVKSSFECDPASFEKLFQNTYGVDLSMFPYCGVREVKKEFAFVFVGSWSLQKGCDLLHKAVKRLGNVRLRHVGSIVDLPFPRDDQMFEHIPSVPQWRLPEFYAQADALVHASRQEGLSNVITQALASGLPIICTDRTGGADLAHTPNLAARITVVPHGDVEALAAAMSALRDRLCGGQHLPPLTDADREHLSWSSYARRYVDRLGDDFALQ
jgi:glycosyltransferase involved in cell wall biosynthesis